MCYIDILRQNWLHKNINRTLGSLLKVGCDFRILCMTYVCVASYMYIYANFETIYLIFILIIYASIRRCKSVSLLLFYLCWYLLYHTKTHFLRTNILILTFSKFVRRTYNVTPRPPKKSPRLDSRHIFMRENQLLIKEKCRPLRPEYTNSCK